MISGALSQSGTLSGNGQADGALSGKLTAPQSISAALGGQSGMSGSLSGTGGINGSLSVGHGSTTYYTGEYTFTPTQDAQIVSINGKTATQNITINPIPSIYGLITWNGSTLTVS